VVDLIQIDYFRWRCHLFISPHRVTS